MPSYGYGSKKSYTNKPKHKHRIDCPNCKKQIKQKQAFQGIDFLLKNTKTFYDDNNRKHIHNPNKHTEIYMCTKCKYLFCFEYYQRCKVCNWIFEEPETSYWLYHDGEYNYLGQNL